MIDINYKYAQWSTNVNVSGMNWQTYHEGLWYNPAEKTYDDALAEIKETIRLQVLKDHPHLIAFENSKEEVAVSMVNGKRLGRPPKVYDAPPIKIINDEPPQYIEPIEKYNLLKEIEACKTPTMLTVLRKMAITQDEIKACDEKMLSFTIGKTQSEPQY